MNITVKLGAAEIAGTEFKDAQANKIIEGFFNVLSGSNESESSVTLEKNAVEYNGHEVKVEVAAKEAVKAAQDIKSKLVTPTRSKQLPLVGSTSTLTHKPFAVLSDSKESHETQTLRTDEEKGIRYTEDDTPLFRTHYWCPSCGLNSKRFIREESDYIKCHECDTKIEVEDAVPNNGVELKQDKHGAYFIARDYYHEV